MARIRLAAAGDLAAVCEIYDRIHTEEEAGRMTIGWNRKIYPTRDTAAQALENHDLYVCEDECGIVASARINRIQVPEYADAAWEYEAKDDEVMVLHTLTVDPNFAGRGYGRKFVEFYEKTAEIGGCKCLRMDTNEVNLAARSMYRKLGYKEISVVSCVFNGIPDVRLVCLEKHL